MVLLSAFRVVYVGLNDGQIVGERVNRSCLIKLSCLGHHQSGDAQGSEVMQLDAALDLPVSESH